MSGKRQDVRVIMELADSAIPLDSEAIADAFAHDLQSDVVTRWSDQVREAIACAKRIPNPLSPVQADSDSRKRAEIQNRIAALQRQLSELAAKEAEEQQP